MDKLGLIPFLYAHFLILISFQYLVHAAPITSCDQTPHPQVCAHFMGPDQLVATLDQDRSHISFHERAIRVTLNQAVRAHQLVSGIDLSSFHDRAKLAWSDCLELYADSVDLLNQSMTSTNPVDSQTWLSAAISNHETCKNGFLDFNSGYLLENLPVVMLTNFSKLISNSLAINKDRVESYYSSAALRFAKQTRGRRLLADHQNGLFPSWVSAADRKLLQKSTGAIRADVVVAQDGSGDYQSVSAAVAASSKRRGGSGRFVIYVKGGVYNENVEVKRSMKNIMVIGDGMDVTVIRGGKSVAGGATTFRSATFAVMGSGFIARDLTIENTAGPSKHQAVALRSGSDFSVFYSCGIKGYQDTLYVYAQRQFYRNCNIQGTIDFIFGDAAAVFQSCNIYVRKPMSGQWTTVTAQGRSDPNENTGIIIHNSHVGGAGGFKVYLGRPWKQYSRTVFMKTGLDGIVSPAGWLAWSGGFALKTLYYGEYMNTGAGASTGGRVNWPGFHVITSPAEAGKFTVGNFLGGNSWIPSTGVPFDSGL